MGFALMTPCAKAAWAMVRMSHQLEKRKSIVMMMMMERTVGIEGMHLHKRGRIEGQRVSMWSAVASRMRSDRQTREGRSEFQGSRARRRKHKRMKRNEIG